jgi:hypothetical protein
MSESSGWYGDGEGWAKSLPHPEPVAQERRGFEASQCEVIVGDATLCLKDRLKVLTVPLLRQTMSSRLSGAVDGLTLTVPSLAVANRYQIPWRMSKVQWKVGVTSFRKPS